MISKTGLQSDRKSNEEESQGCLTKKATMVKHQISNQETDLINEECQENANVSIKSPFQSFIPSHMNLSQKKNSFRLNFSKLNHSSSLDASSHSSKSSSRKQFEELNDLYKEVQRILRKSNSCSSIIGDLLRLLKPIVVNDISKQKIEVVLSERNLPVKESSFLNETITVASQKLIVACIINMVLFKAKIAVTFTSYIMSSAVMILNQVSLQGQLPDVELHQLKDIVGACQKLREYAGKVNSKKLQEVKDDSNEQIQELKSNLSQNLVYDISNYWPTDAACIQENLNENILAQVGLYSGPYSATNSSFSFNRMIILGYEQSHQALQMNEKIRKPSTQNPLATHHYRQLRIKSPQVSSHQIQMSREIFSQTSRVESESKYSGINSDRLVNQKQNMFPTKLKLSESQQSFVKAQNENSMIKKSPISQVNHFKFETPRTNLKNYSAIQEKIKMATRVGYMAKKKGEKAVSNQTSRNYVPNENISDDEEVASIQDIKIQLKK